MEGRVYEILTREGYPLLVARVFGRDPGAASRVLEGFMGRTVGLCEVLEALNSVSGPEEVRIAPAFDPADWADAESWGDWRWPWRTLVKEGACNLKVTVEPVDTELSEVYSPDLTAYMGLGVVWEDPETEETKPLAALIIEPRRPRSLTVFSEEWRPGSVTVKAYTAHPDAVTTLRAAGYTGHPPILVKEYGDEAEMAKELADLEERFEYKGLETFMLNGLDRKIRKLTMKMSS